MNGKRRRQRDVLAERHQDALVVAAEQHAVGSHEEGAVELLGVVGIGAAQAERQAAEDEMSAADFRTDCPCPSSRVASAEIQCWSTVSGQTITSTVVLHVLRQLLVLADVDVEVADVALLLDADVALHQGDAHASVRSASRAPPAADGSRRRARRRAVAASARRQQRQPIARGRSMSSRQARRHPQHHEAQTEGTGDVADLHQHRRVELAVRHAPQEHVRKEELEAHPQQRRRQRQRPRPGALPRDGKEHELGRRRTASGTGRRTAPPG